MDEYKKVNANTFIEVLCTCPYCGALEDVFENVRELLDVMSADNCDKEYTCSECKEVFIIENVHY